MNFIIGLLLGVFLGLFYTYQSKPTILKKDENNIIKVEENKLHNLFNNKISGSKE